MSQRPIWPGTLIVFLSLVTGRFVAAADKAMVKPEAEARLTEVATKFSSGVLLVGHPDRGNGTAFVISKKHRLAATAAHVADLYQGPGTMYAVINGTDVAYRVARVWYHPSLRRRIDEGLTVRSADPVDGPVDVPGPDVALLQLEPGLPLPEEWSLSGPDLLKGIKDQPIALLGYPGYGQWPTRGHPAIATIHPGVVKVEEPFSLEEGVHDTRKQVIEHTAATPEGSSGSPVFSDDGRVVGIHNILKLRKPGGVGEAGMSVRVDALWELLVYHKLDHLISRESPAWDVLVTAEPRVDRQRDNVRRAVQLVHEAEILIDRNDHRTATQRCGEALQLAPGYSRAYLERSRAYTGYCGAHWNKLTPETRRQQAEWAINDAKTSLSLSPDRVDSLCLLLQNVLYLGVLDEDKVVFEDAISGANSLLRTRDLNRHQRSFLTNCRAQAKQYLGDWDGSLRDYTESIRLSPREPFWYQHRADYWEKRGRPDLAAADRQAALGLLPR